MTAFWESVASNIIGTFVGAGLALLTSFFIVRHGETRNDLRLLQGLIDRLYRSRALRPNQVTLPFDSPEVRENERRCAKSVLATRDRRAVFGHRHQRAGRADVLGVVTSLETFDQLHRGRSLTPEQVGERLTATATRTLLTPTKRGRWCVMAAARTISYDVQP